MNYVCKGYAPHPLAQPGSCKAEAINEHSRTQPLGIIDELAGGLHPDIKYAIEGKKEARQNDEIVDVSATIEVAVRSQE